MNRSVAPAPRILVLAAGYSRRLGRPKALTRVHGWSLLRRTVMMLAPFAVAPIVVVVPPRASRYRVELQGLKVQLCVNRRRARGLSSSLIEGLRRARYSCAVLLSPADLPRLRRRDIARLLSRWRGARRRVAARRIDAHGGTPVILPKRLFAQALCATGDSGLRELLRRLPTGDLSLLDLPSAAADIDTAADLRRARGQFASSRPEVRQPRSAAGFWTKR
jgi:molybdenum cofactor cytidylyltransferase